MMKMKFVVLSQTQGLSSIFEEKFVRVANEHCFEQKDDTALHTHAEIIGDLVKGVITRKATSQWGDIPGYGNNGGVKRKRRF